MSHTSVLLQESIEGLDIKEGAIFLDGTFNDGGHSIEVCRRLGGSVKIVGIDLDSDALERARERFLNEPCRISLHQDNFKNLDEVLKKEEIATVDAILLDLGFSSVQLDQSGRGFTFLKEEPLIMTLSKEGEGLTAHTIVNEWEAQHIQTILHHYGEERRSYKIANAIVEARKEGVIDSTTRLAEIIERVVPRRGSRIHPATKTFQALRITVNDEIEALREGLEKGFEALSEGGRMAVISFHSLEDRQVKRFFRKMKDEGRADLITKKPITPESAEIEKNPRSRSAKLRIIKKSN